MGDLKQYFKETYIIAFYIVPRSQRIKLQIQMKLRILYLIAKTQKYLLNDPTVHRFPSFSNVTPVGGTPGLNAVR